MTLKAGISVTENTTSARKTYTTLFYRPTLFFCAELEDRHFAHICNFRPPADERPTTSTQSVGLHRLKVYLVGYNFVADNTATAPFSFV